MSQDVDSLRRAATSVFNATHLSVPDRECLGRVIMEAANEIERLENRVEYLDNSLTAAVSGILPKRFDLNQFLLAQRARGYIRWLETTVDPRDKLVPRTGGGEVSG